MYNRTFNLILTKQLSMINADSPMVQNYINWELTINLKYVHLKYLTLFFLIKKLCYWTFLMNYCNCKYSYFHFVLLTSTYYMWYFNVITPFKTSNLNHMYVRKVELIAKNDAIYTKCYLQVPDIWVSHASHSTEQHFATKYWGVCFFQSTIPKKQSKSFFGHWLLHLFTQSLFVSLCLLCFAISKWVNKRT